MNYKENTISSYNKNPKYFEQRFQIRLNLRGKERISKFERLIKGKKILDLGSGSGDHALYFKYLGYNVLCIDLSEEMIKLCRKKGLNAKLMDIENLRLKKDSFNGVWAAASLLHVPKNKISRVMRKIYNILRKNGVVFIILRYGEGDRLIADKHDRKTKRFFSFWKKKEFLNLVEDDFELISTRKEKYNGIDYLEFFLRKSTNIKR